MRRDFREAIDHSHPEPLTYETVRCFWDGTRSGTAEECLKALCISHERLRAELARAHDTIRQLADRVANQSEALTRRAEGKREIASEIPFVI